MEIVYLIDTNIFLEILLNQAKKEFCKSYLTSKIGKIVISDFSLHSIGVILFRNKRFELYNSFIADILPKIRLVSLPKDSYYKVQNFANQFNLDFDDSYQVAVAESFNLTIATLDADFNKVGKQHKIDYLN